ncbi:uncharacterized protein [Leptinotarsa decemlineata]|uniref:uncharacterized protein n=1 Tax=Leptinotarsa decemlineata TaxID=7539 RepID=UPI003D304D5C
MSTYSSKMGNVLRKSESNEPHGEADRKKNIGKDPLQNTQLHGYPERKAFSKKEANQICNASRSAASVRKEPTSLVNSHQKSTKENMTKKKKSDTNSDTLIDLQQICTRLNSVKRSMKNNNLTTAQRNEIDKTLELSESLIQEIRHSMYACTLSNSNVSGSIQSTNVPTELEHLINKRVVLNGELKELKHKIIILEKSSVKCYESQDHDSYKMIRKICSLFQKCLPENKAIGATERKDILKKISEISERLEKKFDQQKIENKNSDQNQIVKVDYVETDGSSFCQNFSKLSIKPIESEIVQCDINNRCEDKWNEKKSNEDERMQNANEYENGCMADQKYDPKFCELDEMSNKLEDSNNVRRSIHKKKETVIKEQPQDSDHSAEKNSDFKIRNGNQQEVSGTQSEHKVTQEAISIREVGLDQLKESNYIDTDKNNLNEVFSESESSSVEVEILSKVEQSSCRRDKTSNEMKLKQIGKRRDEIKSEIDSFIGIPTDPKFYELKEYSVRLLLEMDDLSFPKGSELHSRKRELLQEVYKYTDILEKKAEMFLFVKTVEDHISYFIKHFDQFKTSRNQLKAIEKKLNHFKSELDKLDPEKNLEDRKQRCIEQINSLNKAVCEEYRKIRALDLTSLKNIEDDISYFNTNFDQLEKSEENLKKVENTLNYFESILNRLDPENYLEDRKRRCIEQITNLKKAVSEGYRKIRALDLTSLKNIEDHISYFNRNFDQLKKSEENLKEVENTLNYLESDLNKLDPENNLEDRKRRCIEQINNLKKNVGEEYRKMRAFELTSETKNIDSDKLVVDVDRKQNLSEALPSETNGPICSGDSKLSNRIHSGSEQCHLTENELNETIQTTNTISNENQIAKKFPSRTEQENVQNVSTVEVSNSNPSHQELNVRETHPIENAEMNASNTSEVVENPSEEILNEVEKEISKAISKINSFDEYDAREDYRLMKDFLLNLLEKLEEVNIENNECNTRVNELKCSIPNVIIHVEREISALMNISFIENKLWQHFQNINSITGENINEMRDYLLYLSDLLFKFPCQNNDGRRRIMKCHYNIQFFFLEIDRRTQILYQSIES